jgi:hypothetical protein
MITKERLQELIEQGATIYNSSFNRVRLFTLNKNMFYEDGELLEYDRYIGEYVSWKVSELFETKQDAEWYREFGCIERTERLELPTWEESKECDTICCFGDVAFDYFVHDNTYCLYQDCYKLLDLEATKENYILACRKAKELFLGEKK